MNDSLQEALGHWRGTSWRDSSSGIGEGLTFFNRGQLWRAAEGAGRAGHEHPAEPEGEHQLAQDPGRADARIQAAGRRGEGRVFQDRAQV